MSGNFNSTSVVIVSINKPQWCPLINPVYLFFAIIFKKKESAFHNGLSKPVKSVTYGTMRHLDGLHPFNHNSITT